MDTGVPQPHILNYYNCNVDTIWIMGAVVIGMIISILFLKIMLWNAIYRHFGECYPMGRLFGSGAVAHCDATTPHSTEETFVGSIASSTSPYPSLHQIVFRPLYDTIRYTLYQMQIIWITIQFRILEHWKHADRTILDMHETVDHMRRVVYDEYIRSYL
jgi:hypothetical protein